VLLTTGSKGVGSQNDIIIQSGSKVDGRIGEGKYNFHISSTYTPSTAACSNPTDITPNGPTGPIGNALNIFVKYQTVVRYWNASTTRIDFLKDIFNVVNSNSYGLFKLIIGPSFQNGPSSVVCYKFSNQDIQSVQDKDSNNGYRFKPNTINSIVRNFSYNFQLDNLISSRMIFNSNAGIRKAYEQKAKTPTVNTAIPLQEESYRSFDYSTFANADGFYSINNVDRRKQQKLLNTINTTNQSTTTVSGQTQDTTTTKDPQPDFTETIKSNSLFYKVSDKTDDKKDPVRLVYRNKPLIYNAINDETGPQGAGKSILTNIEISITIDGFSGFRSGECFNIDGIPEIYNQLGVFQITNIKQNVTDTDGWTTTLEAMWRVGN